MYYQKCHKLLSFVCFIVLPRSGEVQLSLLSNNVKVADCMLKIVKPNLAAYQCLDFIAQALGMDPNDTQGLDTKLVNLFDKSVPSDGTLAEIMKLQEHDLPFTGREYLQLCNKRL